HAIKLLPGQLRQGLQSVLHHVHVVEDGLQALAELARQQFDCVIIDVQMPAMSGVEATKAIRRGEAGEANAGIPVLAMTAHAMVGDKESFLGAGMNGYIAKPVTADELELLLAELTARPGDDPSRT
ncbi:MAG: response regulator, partial [Desulfovibrio sp.]